MQKKIIGKLLKELLLFRRSRKFGFEKIKNFEFVNKMPG